VVVASVGMRAVWSGPKTVIAWSHQQFVRVICDTGAVGRAIGGAVGWEWSRCWRWVGAAIGGTQVVQLELSSGVVGSLRAECGAPSMVGSLPKVAQAVSAAVGSVVPAEDRYPVQSEKGRVWTVRAVGGNNLSCKEGYYMPSSCSLCSDIGL
jgi:hypothetical protein